MILEIIYQVAASPLKHRDYAVLNLSSLIDQLKADMFGDCINDANLERDSPLYRTLIDGLHQLTTKPEYSVCVFKGQPTRVGKYQRPVLTLKKPMAYDILKRFKLRAEGWLPQTQNLTRFRDTSLGGNRFKVIKMMIIEPAVRHRAPIPFNQ
jgi:hypothetical protein